jgi:hypothetical protein
MGFAHAHATETGMVDVGPTAILRLRVVIMRKTNLFILEFRSMDRRGSQRTNLAGDLNGLCRGYSLRKACMGSMAAERRAGSQQASAATAMSKAETAARLPKSTAPTP